MTDFFEGTTGSGTFAPRRKVTHRSKRITKAMENLRRAHDSDDDIQEIAPKEMNSKRKRNPPELIKIESDEEISGMSKSGQSSADEDSGPLQTRRQRRKKSEKFVKGTMKSVEKTRVKRPKL